MVGAANGNLPIKRVISYFPNPFFQRLHHGFAGGEAPPSVVVGGVLGAVDQLLGVIQLLEVAPHRVYQQHQPNIKRWVARLVSRYTVPLHGNGQE